MSVSQVMVRRPLHPDVQASHADHVYSVVQRRRAGSTSAEVSISWQRSAQHRIAPDGREAPRILTSGEVSDRREPLDPLIFSAQDELDRLFKVVREAGYTLLFCDNGGIAVEHRGDESD